MSRTVVVDASATVEILLNTSNGAALKAKFPAETNQWVPEVYFVEVAAVLRRAELGGQSPRTGPPLRSVASSWPR